MRNKSLLLTFASLFALVGCNSGGGEITPKNITLNVNSLTLDVNEEYTLKATVTPENAKYDGISWKSSNTTNVSVSSTGVVKGLIGETTATITAYIDLNKNSSADKNEPKATCSVQVNKEKEEGKGKIKIEITDIKKAAYLYSIGVDLDETVPNEKIKIAAKKLAYQYDYYSSIASWTNGEDLKNKLETLLNDESFVGIKYNSNWLPNQNADESEDNIDNVYLLYSQNEDLKTNTKSSGLGWDREHLFCASLLTGKSTSEATKTVGIATDFHNLYASHTDGNNSRGNKNMGFVDIDDPATNIKTENYISNPTTFMPTSSEDQGIASRSIFYMATKYATSDGIYVREATCSSGDKCHGNLSTMLEWNKNDVTRHELKHNEAIEELQHNRNPYVDFPELVDYVFGDKQDQAGTLASLTPSVAKLGILDHENEFYKYAIGDVKLKYELGETFSKSDVSVYTINKGFAKNKYTGEYSVSIEDGTTFNELGTKTVNVSVGNELIGTYTLEVVDTDVVRDSEYHHYFNYTEDFKDSGAAPDTPEARAITDFTFSGVDWKLTREAGKINGQGSGELGTQFGTGTVSCQKITLESKDDFSYLGLDKIKAIYFEGNCASKESITVKFYLNDVLLKTDTITRPANTGNIHYLAGVTL